MSQDVVHATFDESVRPEDRRKGIIASTLFLIVVIIVLLFPFFSTIFPIPEAEGLAVAFGDVEVAGGGGEVVPTPNVPTPPQPEENNPTDKTTIDDPESEKLDDEKNDNKPTPNTNTNTNTNTSVNNDALFPGGTGTGVGPGKQGDPLGTKDVGGTGRGDQGNGTGEVGNRRIIRKCDDLTSNTSWDEEGTAWIYICVNEAGNVTEASFVSKTNRGDVSSITKKSQQNLAITCAKEYKYEPAAGKGMACGTIPIKFRKQ